MKNRNLRAMMWIVSVFAFAGAGLAQSVWTGGAAGWSSDGNPGWNGTGVPNAIGVTGEVSAATGDITVDGTYTVGTVTNGNATVRNMLGGKLIFDVDSGNARIDFGTGATLNKYAWTSALQLNDNVEIIRALTANQTYFSVTNAAVTGTGGFILNNPGTVGTWTKLLLSNPGNTFSGGVKLNISSALYLWAGTDVAGTGLIDMSASAYDSTVAAFVAFIGAGNYTLNNAISATNSQSSHLRAFVANQTITLNGAISYAGPGGTAFRLGTLSGSPTNVTYILGAGDKSGMGNHPFSTEAAVDTVGVQVDSINSLGAGGVVMMGSAGAVSRLIFNVSGTFTQRVSSYYNPSATSSSNFTFQISTPSAFTGTTVLDSATALSLSYPTGGVVLAIANSAATLEIKSVMDDGGFSRPLTKTGAGTAILSGEAAYGGATKVLGGTLLVNGWIQGAGAVTVAEGATLGGIGILEGATTVNGTLSPGSAAEPLTFIDGLTLAGTSTNRFDINGTTPGTEYDRVVVEASALAYGGTLLVNFGYTPSYGAAFNLFDFGSQSGTFSSIQATGAYTGDADFDYTTGVLTVIPEPGTLGILGFGLVATLLRRKMRKI